MDPFTIGMGVAGLASTVAGWFGGGEEPPKPDWSGVNAANGEYMNFAKSTFGDPNSVFYQKAKMGQQKTLMDIFAGLNLQQMNNMQAQGINPSQKMMSQYNAENSVKATEGANQFGTQLYTQGMGNLTQAYRDNVNTQMGMAQADNAAATAGWQNNENKWAGLATMGAGFMGQAYQNFSGPKVPNLIYNNGTSTLPTGNYPPKGPK